MIPCQIAQRLAESIVAKTDAVLRDAVTQFIGNDAWIPESLSGRAMMVTLPNGLEIFSLDGVALLELHPVVVETTLDAYGSAHVIATRKHRFLVSKEQS